MTLVQDYNSLKTKAIQRQSYLNNLKDQYDNSNVLITQYESELIDLQGTISLYDTSIEVFKSLINKLSDKHISHLTVLLNNMLSTIFTDRNYSISMEVEDSRNTKVLNLYLVENSGTEFEIKTELLNNGGGIQTLVSFTLQVYFILYFKQSPVLFLDEALSAVSTDYLDNLMVFIDSLVVKYNFIFVAVNHDPRFTPYAKSLYEISNGKAKRVR